MVQYLFSYYSGKCKTMLVGTGDSPLTIPFDYNGIIPDGFEAIDLPACQMLMFQGEPYEDIDFNTTILSLMRDIVMWGGKRVAALFLCGMFVAACFLLFVKSQKRSRIILGTSL